MARRSSTPLPDDSLKAKLNRENIKKAMWLFSYLGKYKKMFVPAVCFVLITSLMALAFPFLMGDLVGDATNPDMDLELLKKQGNRVALIMLCILTVQSMITWTRMQFLGRSGDMAVADIRRDAFGKLMRLPMAFYSERRVGELSSRLAADLSLIRDTLVTTLPQFLRQTVILVGGLTFVFFTSWKLALFMVSCLPPVVVAIAIFGFRIRSASRAAQDSLAETNVIVDESLHGIADVKAFSNEQFEIDRYDRGLNKYLDSAFKVIGGRALIVAFVIFALFGVITIVLWYGSRMLASGEIDSSSFNQFVLFSIFLVGAFMAFPEIVTQLQHAIGATDRIREILEEEDEGGDKDPDADADRGRAEGRVIFEDVHFRYPSRPDVSVLEGVSFKANPGERVAIVGPSGAGKSTTISLLMRFFDPEKGSITLDDCDVRECSLKWLRGQMAYVPQEVLLFGGSIRENIAYGNPEASEEEIIEAAKRGNAHQFISEFPEGYDTLVGERGVKLSGGQRQRIAIARAILADPSVLILDEATSSLDAESERLVQGALDELMKGRTSVIIAHRLATVRDADRILVINEGRIVQEGTHEELSSKEGLYRMLSQLQLA